MAIAGLVKIVNRAGTTIHFVQADKTINRRYPLVIGVFYPWSGRKQSIENLRAGIGLRGRSFLECSHKVIVALTVQEILDEHIARNLV